LVDSTSVELDLDAGSLAEQTRSPGLRRATAAKTFRVFSRTFEVCRRAGARDAPRGQYMGDRCWVNKRYLLEIALCVPKTRFGVDACREQRKIAT
jgi:hypothetical protein